MAIVTMLDATSCTALNTPWWVIVVYVRRPQIRTHHFIIELGL
jgi:hypothetical protein